jgi:hypothetical protein
MLLDAEDISDIITGGDTFSSLEEIDRVLLSANLNIEDFML